ncbi:MAG: hypothetical protein AAGA92_05445 [Planctomycetota bacterium]
MVEEHPTLLVKTHPSRLSDDDVLSLQRGAFRHWGEAPAFFGWLIENLQAESQRRAFEWQATPREPQLFAVPLSWSNTELAQALSASAAMTYGEGVSYSLGEFLDKLAGAVVAVAAARLIQTGGN